MIDEKGPTVFMIKSSSGDFSDELKVQNLSKAAHLDHVEGCLAREFQEAIERASEAQDLDKHAWVYQMNRPALSSVMKIHDTSDSGNVAARLDMSILGHYGTWSLSLTDGTDIEMRRLGVFAKEELFEYRGTRYRWDMSTGNKQGRLYREDASGQKLVAQFTAKGWFRNSCILAVEAGELDTLVVLGTCVAALNRDI